MQPTDLSLRVFGDAQIDDGECRVILLSLVGGGVILWGCSRKGSWGCDGTRLRRVVLGVDERRFVKGGARFCEYVKKIWSEF